MAEQADRRLTDAPATPEGRDIEAVATFAASERTRAHLVERGDTETLREVLADAARCLGRAEIAIGHARKENPRFDPDRHCLVDVVQTHQRLRRVLEAVAAKPRDIEGAASEASAAREAEKSPPSADAGAPSKPADGRDVAVAFEHIRDALTASQTTHGIRHDYCDLCGGVGMRRKPVAHGFDCPIFVAAAWATRSRSPATRDPESSELAQVRAALGAAQEALAKHHCRGLANGAVWCSAHKTYHTPDIDAALSPSPTRRDPESPE